MFVSSQYRRRIFTPSCRAAEIVSLMKDDTKLFKQYSDNLDFKRWPGTIFGMTYEQRPD
jgi:type I restriction enzyme R subunit